VSRKHRTGQSGKGRPTPPRKAAGAKSRPTPTRSTRSSAKGPVYKQRRYPPLPLAWKLALGAAWLAALGLTLWLVEPWPGRIGVMIAVTFALPLVVVLGRDPSRRSGRR
jgi:hypothetical protein